MLRRLIVTLVLLTTAVGAVHAQSSSSVMSLEDVVALLQAPQVPREVLESMVRTGCVSFPADDAAISRLRSAGAGDAFVQVVRNACFTGAELVVQSQPAGAEVLIDGQRVGTTPWIGRYASAQTMQVVVRNGNRSLNTSAPLQARQRVSASFAFHEDTVAVPRATNAAEVAAQLNLDRSWTPIVREPRQPGPLRLFTGNFLSTAFTLGTTAGGVYYCYYAENHCFIDPMLNDDGADDLEVVRWLAGGTAGMIVGMTVTGLMQRGINVVKRGNHERAVTVRRDWERSNDAARDEWMRNHPEVLRRLSDNRTSRDRAIQHNQQIRAQNAATQQIQVATEPLPGPGGS